MTAERSVGDLGKLGLNLLVRLGGLGRVGDELASCRSALSDMSDQECRSERHTIVVLLLLALALLGLLAHLLTDLLAGSRSAALEIFNDGLDLLPVLVDRDAGGASASFDVGGDVVVRLSDALLVVVHGNTSSLGALLKIGLDLDGGVGDLLTSGGSALLHVADRVLGLLLVLVDGDAGRLGTGLDVLLDIGVSLDETLTVVVEGDAGVLSARLEVGLDARGGAQRGAVEPARQL